MKPERRHIDFLQDIVNNLEKAESFVEGMDFEDFLADEKTRYCVEDRQGIRPRDTLRN
ncbi:MAG: hypothetical protein NTU95_11185 [Methanothrix sp.]|nr:hypothetical protein [Methanothrix sp.]